MRTQKLITILSVVLGMLLSACQPAAPTPRATEKPKVTITPSEPSTQAATQAADLMCIIVPEVENPYFGAMQEMAARKAEELGYRVLKLVHDDDANKQNEQIDICIAQHAVAILLNNASADASVAAIQRAKEAGIPTFLIDREISMEGVAVSQIIFDNYQGATLLAKEFARLMEEEGEYIELAGRVNDMNAQVRSQAYHAVLDALPEMKMVAQKAEEWSAREVFEIIEPLLQAYPNVKGVICGNDTMALAAQAVLEAARMDNVIVVGFGGSDDVNQSIMEGKVAAGILPPVDELATQAVIQADLYLRTGSIGKPEKQAIDMVLITPANVCMYTAFAPNGRTDSCPAIRTKEPTTATDGPICIIVPGLEDPYFFANQQGIAARRAEELGYTVLKLVHNDDANKQSELIDYCIERKARAILLNHAGADASVPAIQRAKEAGIPTFLIDREINREGVAVSQIVFDDYQGATLLAKEFARLMDEAGEYIELAGRVNDMNAQVRSQAYHAVLDALPEMKMVARQIPPWSANEAFDDLASLLQQYPNLKGVICDDDSAALGMQAALESAGMSDVIVVGFDGSRDMHLSIMNGEIDAGILPPADELATQAVIQMDRYLHTGSTGLPEKQFIDMVLITPANACMYNAFVYYEKASCP